MLAGCSAWPADLATSPPLASQPPQLLGWVFTLRHPVLKHAVSQMASGRKLTDFVCNAPSASQQTQEETQEICISLIQDQIERCWSTSVEFMRAIIGYVKHVI